MRLAASMLIVGLTIIGFPYSSKATPITCNLRGCSDWNHTPANVVHRTVKRVIEEGVRFLPHPRGCPKIAFCACGASVEVFGRSIRSLWLARAWFKFPRTHATPGAVAVRSHHVFVLVRHVEGNQWLIKDFNSGGHQSREHVRSITGWVIVDPRGGKWAAL